MDEKNNILNQKEINTISLPSSNYEDTSNYNTRSLHQDTEIVQNTKPEFSLNTISDKSINILGFDLYFDDIIIIALILFLMQEEKKDYLLIGVLGLMFFDFSLDKIKNFEPIQKLFSSFT